MTLQYSSDCGPLGIVLKYKIQIGFAKLGIIACLIHFGEFVFITH